MDESKSKSLKIIQNLPKWAVKQFKAYQNSVNTVTQNALK